MSSSLPSDAIELLVSKVVAKFMCGEINLEEAASRLVGTGKFDENQESLDYLRNTVCPQLETKLTEVEDEILKLQTEADRIRMHLGLPVTGTVRTAKKEKSVTPKVRKGVMAEGGSEIFDKEEAAVQ
jgi:hypothetical protein